MNNDLGNVFNASYIGKRDDVEGLVPSDIKFVLDVGCSTGVLGASIKAHFGAMVVGIEISDAMAAKAKMQLDRVLIGDAAEIIKNGSLEGMQYDLIIFADLLEHLVDPWGTLKASVAYLTPGGCVVASIPNVRHIDTIYNLLVKGVWPYRDRGIHDRTHLRFFTRKNIEDLFEGAGLTIEVVRVNYRFFEKPYRINRFARLAAFPWVRNFLAFQYLVRARASQSSNG